MSPRHSSALTVEHILLAILDKKPMHGYELYQELYRLEGISHVWSITQAMLYVILDRLEDKGFLTSCLVQGDAYQPRKCFTLTEVGKQSLQTWMSTPARRARDLRQEFLAKLIVARRYGQENALGLIRRQEQVCQGWSAELQDNVPPLDAEHLDEWLVHSFRVNQVEWGLHWLRKCETEISRLAQPGLGDGQGQAAAVQPG